MRLEVDRAYTTEVPDGLKEEPTGDRTARLLGAIDTVPGRVCPACKPLAAGHEHTNSANKALARAHDIYTCYTQKELQTSEAQRLRLQLDVSVRLGRRLA